jgi:pSer/pThr/pTyr-binding forkhead associated (FHA) protein
VSAFLEVWLPAGSQLVPLLSEKVAIGRHPDNDIVLGHDRTVSRWHARMEPHAGGWCIQDLGSHAGTIVSGQAIIGLRVLRDSEELQLGRTRLVFRTVDPPELAPTEGAERAPTLTPRERDVLLALCRPLFSGRSFAEPASMRQIAEELVVSEAAVKQHLLRLYEKFGLTVDDAGGRRRVLLANEAVRRRAVSLSDLVEPPH